MCVLPSDACCLQGTALGVRFWRCPAWYCKRAHSHTMHTCTQPRTTDVEFDNFYMTREEHLKLMVASGQYLGPVTLFQDMLRRSLFGLEWWLLRMRTRAARGPAAAASESKTVLEVQVSVLANNCEWPPDGS